MPSSRRWTLALEARLYPPDAPRRLVVQIYGSGIGVQTEKLWHRFKGTGFRVPLNLDGARGPETFLRKLFGAADGRTAALFSALKEAERSNPLHAWVVECQDALHGLCSPGTFGDALAGVSYERLRTYRDELTRALYSKIQSGVESPQAFAAYARGLKIAPAPDALLHSNDVLQAFVRDVLLTGNGTLFVNNTFVEWAAVQALRRAQPRVLVTRYGVRDKLKPFSSLLLFSQPRESDQIPLIEDPLGSFIDVEQLSYYVWLNAEKSAAYRKKTLYLFLAEGVDEMLAVRSDMTGPAATSVAQASLPDVCATMAQWLGISVPESGGRAISRDRRVGTLAAASLTVITTPLTPDARYSPLCEQGEAADDILVQDTHQPSGLFVAGADFFPELPLDLFASCADLLPNGREFIVHLGSELHNLRLHPIHPFGKPLQVRHASLQPFHSLFNRLRRHQQHSGGPCSVAFTVDRSSGDWRDTCRTTIPSSEAGCWGDVRRLTRREVTNHRVSCLSLMSRPPRS